MSENGWNLLEMAITIGNVWSWLLKAENGMKWLEVASNGQRFCGRCLDFFSSLLDDNDDDDDKESNEMAFRQF